MARAHQMPIREIEHGVLAGLITGDAIGIDDEECVAMQIAA